MFRFAPVVASQLLTTDTHHSAVYSQTSRARQLIANGENQVPSEHLSGFSISDIYLRMRCATAQSPLPR